MWITECCSDSVWAICSVANQAKLDPGSTANHPLLLWVWSAKNKTWRPGNDNESHQIDLLWLPLSHASLFFKQYLPNPQLWMSFHALITSSCSLREEDIASWLNEKLTFQPVRLHTEWLTGSFAKQQTAHTYYKRRFINATHGGKK